MSRTGWIYASRMYVGKRRFDKIGEAAGVVLSTDKYAWHSAMLEIEKIRARR